MTREEAIREVVRPLVDYYQPEKIYLIGSSARGEARPDSDLDSSWSSRTTLRGRSSSAVKFTSTCEASA